MIFPTLWTVVVGGASPTVRDTVGAEPAPARVARGLTYTPVAGDRVIVSFVSGRLYILGAF